MALFDTDVLIDHLRGVEGAKEALLKFADEANYCSVITSGEILFGMRKEEKQRTFALLQGLSEIPVDSEIVRLAYEVKTRAKDYKLRLYDCIISATALKHDQLLVTRNGKHYPEKQLKLFIPSY